MSNFPKALVAVVVSGLAAMATAQPSAPPCPAPPAGSLSFGYTVTHVIVDPGAEAQCRGKGGSGATIRGEQNILSHYDDPAVRARVVEMLAQMNAEGATVLRTNLWFRHAEDLALTDRSRDPLGLLVATGGRLESKYLANLEQYIRDARIAGYRSFILIAGVQGTSNPRCRGDKEWGACYDASLTPKTWSVIEQVVSRLRSADLAGMNIIYDIAPSSCSPDGSTRLVDRNLGAYSRYLVKQYKLTFGDSRFIASCGGADDKRAIKGITSQAKMFRELGVKPAAIDLHVYETERADVMRLAKVADREASALGVPLIIAETFFDHPNVFELVKERKRELPQLTTFMVWPRLTASACQFSISPPYSLKPIVQKVGPVAAGCPVRK